MRRRFVDFKATLNPLFQVLKPLGMSIYKVEGDKENEKKPKNIQGYLVVGGVILFLSICIGVLTIKKKRLAYRDRNICTASIYRPPKAANPGRFGF
jgi:hypothetical protein